MERHIPYWSPDPFKPLETPRWEVQVRQQIEDRVTQLLAAYAAGRISRKEFIDDRKMGMKNCLWLQHHKNDQRHKNLGRPFWSVEAYIAWVKNIKAMPQEHVWHGQQHSLRTLQRLDNGKLRAFLRHEHVIPKTVMIQWLEECPDRVPELLDKNVCCVITREEEQKIDRRFRVRHPDRENPWSRYAGSGIHLLFNPDWPEGTLGQLQQYGLISRRSYRPFEDLSPR